MEKSEFNDLIDQLKVSDDWLHFDCLAGVSESVREFAHAIEDLTPSCDRWVLVERASRCHRVDEGLLEKLGFKDALKATLHRHSPMANSSLLFGNGCNPGAFEEKKDVVLVGLECLDESHVDRLLATMKAWRKMCPKRVLVLTEPCENAKRFLTESEVPTDIVALLPVVDRKQDLPYIMHHFAQDFGTGIEHFDIECVRLLLKHPWLGDLREMERRIRSICDVTTSDQFVASETVLDELAKSPNHFEATTPTTKLEQQLNDRLREIQTLTTSLLGQPFFQQSVETGSVRSQSAEVGFLRRVSWAYQVFFETGKANFSCVERHFEAQRLEFSQLKQMMDDVRCLRTYLQHSLAYDSERDQDTLERVASWFNESVGRRYPREEDFETCSNRLISDMLDALAILERFLNRLNDDEYRATVLRQWRKQLERTLPKHEIDTLIGSVLEDLGRNDLEATIVSNKLLKPIRDYLELLADGVNQEEALREFVERKVIIDFPEALPVSGKDLIAEGYKPGPEIGRLIKALTTRHKETGESKTELIAYARTLTGPEVI